MRLDDRPESQPFAPAPDDTADAPLPPLLGAGEGLAASSPESLQPDPGAEEGQSPAEAPSLADAPAPPTADARLSAGIGQPASPDDSADLPPVGAAPPGERPPLSPAAAALDNARRGTWMMDEHLDGWVLLGADGKPVMRNDGSRVGFRFYNVARLADELAAAPDDADGADNPRRALAPLDSGFNRDWDPQIPKSALADRTKLVKLLAYHYVQTTEPQEAVRRAVSDIFGDPTYIEQPGMKAWVPGKYDAEAVKSVAGTLLRQVLGPEAGGSAVASGAVLNMGVSPATRTIRGVPLDGRGLNANLVNTAAADQADLAERSMQVVQEGGGSARASGVPTQVPDPSSGKPPENTKDLDRLTFRDALEHYAKGNGQAIRIPLNSLDLSKVSASDFSNDRNELAVTLPGEDGLTIGTITLKLTDRGTVRTKKAFDTYNFDMKFEKPVRDALTALGYLVNEGYALGSNVRIERGPLGVPIPVTKGGTPYKIYLDGEAKIKP